MSTTIRLFDIDPGIDRGRAKADFQKHRRVQIRTILTPDAAQSVHDILSRRTPWGIAWQAAEEGPYNVRREQLGVLAGEQRAAIGAKVAAAMSGRGYGFLYGQYHLVQAYLEKWAEGGPHDLILEHINSPPLLDLVREVTGIPQLIKADAQATLYGPNQFLAMHDDSHVAQGWRVAYVMSFCKEDWRPDWGGYLMFYDEDGDVVAGFKPRFNALNLFLVPQKHNVTYVPPFAPVGRFSITGWFRDK